MLRVECIGNLGQDAEVKQTQGQTPYTYVKFSVAGKSHKNDDTVWLNCSWFGREAVAVAPRLTKGTQVFVEGRYKVRTYQTHAGEDRISHDVDVKNLIVLTGHDVVADDERGESHDDSLPF